MKYRFLFAFVLFPFLGIAQTISYETFNTSTNFPHAIDLSKSVGAINGSASVSETGAETYAIPIEVAPGSLGMIPQIGLTYSSQSGNGIIGMGWGLSGLSAIGRNGYDTWHDDKVSPIEITNNDHFFLEGALLIPVTGSNGANNTIYGTEAESYSKIISHGLSGSGPAYFTVWLKNRNILEYGNTTDSKIFSIGTSDVIGWKLNKQSDKFGNFITYSYYSNSSSAPIKDIWYTGNDALSQASYAHVKFNYLQGRIDLNTSFVAGHEFYQTELLGSIEIYTDNNTFVRSYTLSYANDNIHSFLQSVKECGLNNDCFNETSFRYEGLNGNLETPSTMYGLKNSCSNGLNCTDGTISGDFNGDGFSDVVQEIIDPTYVSGANTANFITGFYVKYRDPSSNNFINPRFFPLPQYTQIKSLYKVPTWYSYHVNDFDGDGTDDILVVFRHYNPSAGDIIDSIEVITKLNVTPVILTYFAPSTQYCRPWI